MNPSSSQYNPLSTASRSADQTLYNNLYNKGLDVGNPYFQQAQDVTAADLANTVNTRNTGYNTDVAETQNQLGIASRDLTNQEGEKGTWGSSARDIRMNSLANTYGNQLSNLYNTTQGANTKSLIAGEYALGGGTMNLPQSNISKYSVNMTPGSSLGAYGAKANPSSAVKYNPFGYSGTNKANYVSGAANYANDQYGLLYPNRRVQ